MGVHVIDEADRCLHCKNPMCQKGCPIHTAVPEIIELFREGNLDKAGELLFENNPLSMVCSLICNHEKQCEGSCILGRKGSPVHISSTENYISDMYFDKMKISCAPKKGKMAAVIGSGPAGITIAIILTRMGYDVTIFESKDMIGGVLQYGIPEFRLPKSILRRYARKLREIGVSIRPNCIIGGALTIDDLFKDGYKSVFIGTGVWRPKTLGIRGESLGNVHFGIDYLANPQSFRLGDRVAVIGMGNTAIDVARTALRSGAKEVTLYARRKKAGASSHELEYAKLDGADFVYGKAIQEITPEGPVFKENYFDDDGNITGESEETEQVYADSTIIAVSQGPKNKLVTTTEKLETNKKGLLITDESGETTREGIFAAGDVVLGARTVVEAVAYAKNVAYSMHEYMESLDENEESAKQ